MVLLPRVAGAFWPFTVSKAQVSDAQPHDSSMALLDGATNADPNPEKGGTELQTTGDTALMANVGPDGSVAESGHASTQSGEITTYTVKEGDTLSVIASKFGVSVNTILWANNVAKASTIKAGDTLIILPVSGVRYTVKSGDTLAGIAKKYGADSEEIGIFNGLASSAELKSGSEIIIPGGEITAAAKPAVKTTTKTTTKAAISTGGGSTPTSSYFINPVSGAILTQGIHGNNGVDLGAPAGTPISAAAAGTVIISKTSGWNGGYGSYVVVSHGNGMQTLYSHMSKDVATVGETVSAGDLLGYVGATGEATGNHLHFEVRGGKNWLGACTLMKACR